MSKLKTLASTAINALGTVFSAAVMAGSAGFAGITAQKMIESGDYNAAALPLTAAFMAVSWGALTTMAAKSTKSEFKSLFPAQESNKPQIEPGV